VNQSFSDIYASYPWSHNGIVSIVTRLRAIQPRNHVNFQIWSTVITSPKHPDQFWSQPSFLFNGYKGLIREAKQLEHEADHTPFNAMGSNE
jgi:hypothetical protein